MNVRDYAKNGWVHVTTAGAKTGSFVGFLALSDCVISTMDAAKSNDAGSAVGTMTALNIPAGIYFPCTFTSATFTSGEALLQNA